MRWRNYNKMKKIVLTFIIFLIFQICFSQSEKNNSDSCYAVKNKDTIWSSKCVQEIPQFPGGESEMKNFLRRNIQYPYGAMHKNLQGKVIVSIVIDTSGAVTNIEVYKDMLKTSITLSEQEYKDGVSQLNEEAMRIFRIMPKWSSGKINGKKVKVAFVHPIMYKMQ